MIHLRALCAWMYTAACPAVQNQQRQKTAELHERMVKKGAVKSLLTLLAGSEDAEAQRFAAALSEDARFELVPSTEGGATSTFDEAHDLLRDRKSVV